MTELQGLVKNLFDKNRLTGIPTGYKSLDSIIGGLKSGTLAILAGSTGMGKSLLGINILSKVAKDGYKVGYFDLENGTDLSIERLIKIWFGVNSEYFEEKENMEMTEDMLWEVYENLNYWDHEMLYKWGLKKLGIGLLEKIVMAERPRVVMIDPLQALETETSDKSALNEQGKIVQKLKELAQNTGCSIILCHHIRKSMTGSGTWVKDIDDSEETRYRLPTLEDLRGSGKISDFATDVWGIVRTKSSPTPEGRAKTLLRVLKNRTGVEGDIKLHFKEDTLQFFEVISKDPVTIFDGGI